MFELMYYPLVHPPRRTIFESVLYWDRLASLVPGGAGVPEYDFSGDLDLLMQENLYRPTWLEGLMLNDHEAYSRVMRTIGRVLADDGDFAIPDNLGPESRLWFGKLPAMVEQDLIRQRLLVPDETNQDALRGNPRVLLATMACFAEEASMILETSNRRVVPTTDNVYAHECTTLPLDESEVRVSWMLDVAPLLPVPEDSTPLEDVLAFRHDNREALDACMRASRELLAAVRNEGITNPKEVVMEFERRLVEAVTEVRNSGLQRFMWAVKRSTWVAVATTAATTASVIADGPAVAVGTATVVGGLAVNLATSPTRVRDDRFSYLHQLTTNLGNHLPAQWVGARL